MTLRTLLCIVMTLESGLSLSAQDITGEWDFAGITHFEGDTLLPVEKGDVMHISGDSTFEYRLAAKDDLHAAGEWAIDNDTLVFTYEMPSDTVRYYRITQLTENRLVISEAPVHFAFRRAARKKPGRKE